MFGSRYITLLRKATQFVMLVHVPWVCFDLLFVTSVSRYAYDIPRDLGDIQELLSSFLAPCCYRDCVSALEYL